MKGPARQISTVGSQEVRLRLPRGLRPAKVSLLSAQKDLPFRVADSEIRFTVPQVGEYEVVAIA
jgi:hypothetical protein